VYSDVTSAREALLATLGQGPTHYGYTQSRWTLKTILRCCAYLRLKTVSGLHQLLARLRIGLKRGRHYVHSPDTQYAEKVAYIQTCADLVKSDPAQYVLVYLDEFSFYRQPSLGNDYTAGGANVAPLARRSYLTDSSCRGIGALDALSGQLTYAQHSRLSTRRIAQFYHTLAQAYPQAKTIFVVQDNWAVHYHPDILAALVPQVSPFKPPISSFWTHLYHPDLPTGQLPIQMLFLPTYAPWLNPIEKVWRFLRQSVLHLHRLADAWPQLKQRVLDFMAHFHSGSTDLLSYVGLLPH
jgi:transposase